MHIAIRKSLGNGATSIVTAACWDLLKYQLTKLDYFVTVDWDSHNFAWEQFWNGDIINDGTALWRYFNAEMEDLLGVEIFEGRVIFLIEIDDME